MNHLNPNALNMFEPYLHRGQHQIIERAIFKTLFVRLQIKASPRIHSCHDRTKGDRATGIPGAAQFGQRGFPREQASNTGGIAEDLIERERDKVGVPPGEVQAIGGNEGGAIHEHIPPPGMGFLDPIQWMLHARDVRLGGVGKQVRVFRTSLIERTEEKLLVHPQIGWLDGHIREARSFAMSKLTDAVDGVVVIEGEEVLPTRNKGIRLPYELKRTCGISCHEPRGLKPSGLHLGASRCKRLHDDSPRDIESGVPISVTGVATLHTTKRGLGLAVGFRTVSTCATRARRMARIDRMQWHASKSSLVGKEQTQLSKGPGGMARTLRLPNRAIRPRTDVS